MGNAAFGKGLPPKRKQHLTEALRARRLASKLEQVEGRTPEEAAAFQEKARRLRSV